MKEHAGSATSRYLDPLSDAGFMQLFGSQAPKEILIDFLNALLKGSEVIRDLEHKPPTHSGAHPRNGEIAHPRNGEILMDLLCTGEKGEQFFVHLQRSSQGIAYESLCYNCARLLADQPDPEESGVGCPMRAYVVGLMNFIVPTCERHGCIMDRQMEVIMGSVSGESLYDVKLAVKAIEVPRFTKSENELQTDLDKWLFLLRNLGEMKEIAGSLKNTPFEKVFLAAVAS